MAYLKLISFIILVSLYFLTSLPFYVFSLIYRYQARKCLIKIASFYAKLSLILFRIKFMTINKKIKKGKIGRLIISNHLSYLDALIMQAENPSCFVTSIEMKKTPFLGQICEAAGCLYVERRSRDNLSEEIKDITNALKLGLDVVIYPEGTSTNGEEVKRFKRPLFQAAIDSGASIIPQTINYELLNNEKISTKNRDFVCWYGSMSFLPHLISVFNQKNIFVKIIIGNEIKPTSNDIASDLANKTHALVNSHFSPIEYIN